MLIAEAQRKYETIGVDVRRILILKKYRREDTVFFQSIAVGYGLDG
jgi:hypothetical protein